MDKKSGRSSTGWKLVGDTEQNFLLDCLRAEETPPAPPMTLEWERLADLAQRDGLSPILYSLYQDSSQHVPRAIFARLKHSYKHTQSANNLYIDELRRLGHKLEGIGARLLVLRNAALALSVHRDPALCLIDALNVTVREEHTMQAFGLLRDEGYERHEADNKSVADDPISLESDVAQLRLARQTRGKPLELVFHWPLREPTLAQQLAELYVSRLWLGAVVLEEAANLWQPAQALMLVDLCMHTGLHSRFSALGLRPYVDIDRLIRRHSSRPDFWMMFVAEAQRAHVAHVSYFSLVVARELLGTQVPEEVLNQIQAPRWKVWLFERYFEPDDALNRTPVFFDRRELWWRLISLDHTVDVLPKSWQVLFPHEQTLSRKYHR